MSDIGALIKRLEAADEDTDWDELSAEIMQVVEGFVTSYATPYTTSVDAALTVIPEGWRVFALYGATKGKARDGASSEQPWHAILEHVTDWRTVGGSSWASAPLAICIAALKARSQT